MNLQFISDVLAAADYHVFLCVVKFKKMRKCFELEINTSLSDNHKFYNAISLRLSILNIPPKNQLQYFFQADDFKIVSYSVGISNKR